MLRARLPRAESRSNCWRACCRAWPGPGRIRLLTGAPLDGWLDGRAGRVHHLAFATAEPADIDGATPVTEDGTFEVDPGANHGVRLRLRADAASFASRPLG